MKSIDFNLIKEGFVLPELKVKPLTRHTLALFCGASCDHNPIHVDFDYAHDAGLNDVIGHGMLSMAYVGRLITNWVPQSSIREIKSRFTAMTYIGDSIICRGTVKEKLYQKNEIVLKLELTAETKKNRTIISEALLFQSYNEYK